MTSTELLQLAADQHGAVSHHQLTCRLGMSRSAIYRARRGGALVDIVPGVVRLASSPETFLARCMAVQLKAGNDGFLSGWTAGRLVGLRSMPVSRIHFTIPIESRIRMPSWVDLHRTKWYDAEHDRHTRKDNLVIAHPMRMLFGLAATFDQIRFERAAEDAWHCELITPDSALDYLQAHRCRGKDGVLKFELWLERTLGQDRPAQSNLERDLINALEGIGLEIPVRQHPLALNTGVTIHIDIAWPHIKLAVEPGASWWHGGDSGQRKDQARDRACSELGWSVIRFDETMRDDVRAAARQVARIYRQRERDHLDAPKGR